MLFFIVVSLFKFIKNRFKYFDANSLFTDFCFLFVLWLVLRLLIRRCIIEMAGLGLKSEFMNLQSLY